MTTYYVSPNGNDLYDGFTEETAKKTLGAIEKVVEPGDVVYTISNILPEGEITKSGSK